MFVSLCIFLCVRVGMSVFWAGQLTIIRVCLSVYLFTFWSVILFVRSVFVCLHFFLFFIFTHLIIQTLSSGTNFFTLLFFQYFDFFPLFFSYWSCCLSPFFFVFPLFTSFYIPSNHLLYLLLSFNYSIYSCFEHLPS